MCDLAALRQTVSGFYCNRYMIHAAKDYLGLISFKYFLKVNKIVIYFEIWELSFCTLIIDQSVYYKCKNQ